MMELPSAKFTRKAGPAAARRMILGRAWQVRMYVSRTDHIDVFAFPKIEQNNVITGAFRTPGILISTISPKEHYLLGVHDPRRLNRRRTSTGDAYTL